MKIRVKASLWLIIMVVLIVATASAAPAAPDMAGPSEEGLGPPPGLAQLQLTFGIAVSTIMGLIILTVGCTFATDGILVYSIAKQIKGLIAHQTDIRQTVTGNLWARMYAIKKYGLTVRMENICGLLKPRVQFPPQVNGKIQTPPFSQPGNSVGQSRELKISSRSAAEGDDMLKQ